MLRSILVRALERAAFAGVLCMAMAAAAWAQDRVAVNGPWTAQCRVDRVAGKACEVQAVHDVRKPPLANYWLTYTLKDRVFAVIGAPCPAAGRVWIDRHQGAEFESCGRCACRVRAEESARLFELARTGKSIFLEIKDAKGSVFGPYETRLRDFEKSYRAAAAHAAAR